jgi:hypothetical protein
MNLSRVITLTTLLSLCGCQAAMDLVSPPGRAICRRTGELCGLDKKDVESCEKDVAELKVDKERLRELSACVDKSQSCAEAAGCAAGMGINAAMEQGKQFLKGLQRSLK